MTLKNKLQKLLIKEGGNGGNFCINILSDKQW